MAKSTKKPSTKKGTSKRRRKDEPEDGGNHVRQLAPERAVKSFITSVIATKNRTSAIGQELSTETRRASEAGVNVPAARIAARLYAKAKQDSLKGRVLWEDVQYYLTECTDFDKVAPVGMFTAEESSGRRKGKQAEMELEDQNEQAGKEAYSDVELVEVVH